MAGVLLAGCGGDSSDAGATNQDSAARTGASNPAAPADPPAGETSDRPDVDYATLACPTPDAVNDVHGYGMDLVVSDEPVVTDTELVGCDWTGPGPGEYAHRVTVTAFADDEFDGHLSFLKATADSIPDELVLVDDDSGFVYANDQATVNGPATFISGGVRGGAGAFCTISSGIPVPFDSIPETHVDGIVSFFVGWCTGQL